jgi:GntR family transcriptional regulator/MocR family aminotransferase
MTVERRRRVLQWAAETGAVVIEHDWAGAIRYRGAPLPSLQSEDAGTHVVHVGSFLETMAAGSVAYAIVPDRLLERFTSAMTSSDLPPSGLDQRALARFITDGHLDRHLRRARLALQERQTYLVSLLRHELGCRVVVEGQEAGEHLIVHVTPQAGVAVKDLMSRCSKLGLELSSLGEFALGSHADEGFVISYGASRESDLKAAVTLIARAMDQPARTNTQREARLSA